MQHLNLPIRKISLLGTAEKVIVIFALIVLAIASVTLIVLASVILFLSVRGSITAYMYIAFIPLAILSLFLIFLFFLLVTGNRQYVQILDDGIYCLGKDYELYTPWSNVTGLGRQRISPSIVNTLELKEVPSRDILIPEGIVQKRAVVERRRWLSKEPQYTVSFPLGSIFSKAWHDGELSRTLQTAFAASQGYPLPISIDIVEREEPPQVVSPEAPPWFWLWLGSLLLLFILSIIYIREYWLPLSIGCIVFGAGSYVFSLYHIHFAKIYRYPVFQMGLYGSIILLEGINILISGHFPGNRSLLLFALPFAALLVIVARRKIKKLQELQRQAIS